MCDITLPHDLIYPILRYANNRLLLTFFHSAKKFGDIWKWALEKRFDMIKEYDHFSHIEYYFMISDDNHYFQFIYSKYSIDRIIYNSYSNIELEWRERCIKLSFRKRYIVINVNNEAVNYYDDHKNIFIDYSGSPSNGLYIIDLSKIQLNFKNIKIFRPFNKNSIMKLNSDY